MGYYEDQEEKKVKEARLEAEKAKNQEIREVLFCICAAINAKIKDGDERLPSVFLVPSKNASKVDVYELIVSDTGKRKPGKFAIASAVSLDHLPGMLRSLKIEEQGNSDPEWLDEI